MNKQTLVVARLILSTFVAAVIPAGIDSATAQTTTVTPSQSDEQNLRDLVRQENEGKKAIQFTEDCIFVSGAWPRPLIGQVLKNHSGVGVSHFQRERGSVLSFR